MFFASLWGFFLGRPFRINMEDVTVGKPGRHLINERVRKWSAYGLSDSCTTTTPLTDNLQLLSQYRVQLCEIMAPLGHALCVLIFAFFLSSIKI